MKNIITLTLSISILLLVGCTEKPKPQPIVPPKPVFKTYIDLPEENWPPKDNNATQTIDISDLISTNIQDIPKTGKVELLGTISLLSPNCSIINGVYSSIYIRNMIGKEGANMGSHMASTMSDESGKFEFHKIPNGRYKLFGSMNCGAECGYDTNKTITLSKIVILDRNSTYRINLTNIKPKK